MHHGKGCTLSTEAYAAQDRQSKQKTALAPPLEINSFSSWTHRRKSQAVTRGLSSCLLRGVRTISSLYIHLASECVRASPSNLFNRELRKETLRLDRGHQRHSGVSKTPPHRHRCRVSIPASVAERNLREPPGQQKNSRDTPIQGHAACLWSSGGGGEKL